MDNIKTGNQLALLADIHYVRTDILHRWINLTEDEKKSANLQEIFGEIYTDKINEITRSYTKARGYCVYCLNLDGIAIETNKCGDCQTAFCCEKHFNLHSAECKTRKDYNIAVLQRGIVVDAKISGNELIITENKELEYRMCQTSQRLDELYHLIKMHPDEVKKIESVRPNIIIMFLHKIVFNCKNTKTLCRVFENSVVSDQVEGFEIFKCFIRIEGKFELKDENRSIANDWFVSCMFKMLANPDTIIEL
jgi:hypothetical protein